MLYTCLPERLFGRLGIFILFNPTPIAPELTRTTLCPCVFNCITVSTMDERVDSNGWCVFSWTIEEVPVSRKYFPSTPILAKWHT